MMTFRKMEGCGNDFVVLEAAQLAVFEDHPENLRRFVLRLCDRHFGIGADGLLTWETRMGSDALQVRMQYWNADGSRAEMCGNGARCVVRHAWEQAGKPGGRILLTTDRGTRAARVDTGVDGVVVAVDMGAVSWEPQDIPFEADAPFVEQRLDVAGDPLPVSALAVGNPHAIVFVDTRPDFDAIDLQKQGQALATHARFPRGANASFVHLENALLHLRVWERGVGPTLACGTASCAAVAVARRTARIAATRVTVQLPGGRVQVEEHEDGHLWLAGPATSVASGTLHPDWLAPLLPPDR